MIIWAISESASSWLLLDCSPHDMTVDSFPAITKSISFCSRYVCNLSAKKEVNCWFVLVWDKISLKPASLISKTYLHWIRQGLHFQDAQITWSSLEKYRNRSQRQWQPHDPMSSSTSRQNTSTEDFKGFNWRWLWHFLNQLRCVYCHYICTGTLRSWNFGLVDIC